MLRNIQQYQSTSQVGAVTTVLLQGGEPFEYASRSFTCTETRWAPIETKIYAICFAGERFSQYI